MTERLDTQQTDIEARRVPRYVPPPEESESGPEQYNFQNIRPRFFGAESWDQLIPPNAPLWYRRNMMATLQSIDRMWPSRANLGAREQENLRRLMLQVQQLRSQLATTQGQTYTPTYDTSSEGWYPDKAPDLLDDRREPEPEPEPEPEVVSPGQDIRDRFLGHLVNRALEDPNARTAYQESLLKQAAARLGSPGTGFSNAFVLNGAIYSSNGLTDDRGTPQVLRYNEATQRWVPVSRQQFAGNMSVWDTLIRTGYDMLQQATRYVPPPSPIQQKAPLPDGAGAPIEYGGVQWVVTDDGRVYDYNPQRGWTFNNSGLAQQVKAMHFQDKPMGGTAAPDFSTPVDVGVGNLRWNGTQFVGYNNAPVNPMLLQSYAKQLRNMGWVINGMQVTPPPLFGRGGTGRAGETTLPGTNKPKNKFGYVPAPTGGARTVMT